MSLLGLLPSDHQQLSGSSKTSLLFSSGGCKSKVKVPAGPGSPSGFWKWPRVLHLPWLQRHHSKLCLHHPMAACPLGSDFPRPSPMSLPLFYSWLCHTVCRILVPQPGIEPGVEKVPSPKHWPTRESPLLLF